MIHHCDGITQGDFAFWWNSLAEKVDRQEILAIFVISIKIGTHEPMMRVSDETKTNTYESFTYQSQLRMEKVLLRLKHLLLIFRKSLTFHSATCSVFPGHVKSD